MAIKAVCGNCKSAFAVKDELAGRSVLCPKCKQLLKIPGGAAAPANRPAAGASPARQPSAAPQPQATTNPAAAGNRASNAGKPGAAPQNAGAKNRPQSTAKSANIDLAAELGLSDGLKSDGLLDDLLTAAAASPTAPRAQRPSAQGPLAQGPLRPVAPALGGRPVIKSSALPWWTLHAAGGSVVAVLLVVAGYLLFIGPRGASKQIGEPPPIGSPSSAAKTGSSGTGSKAATAAQSATANASPVRQLGPGASGVPGGPSVGSPMSVSDIIEKVDHGIVLITVRDASGQDVSLGTGFVIDKSGLVATNLHVVGEGNSAYVQFRDGSKFEVRGYRAADASRDLAILELAGKPDRIDVLPLWGDGNPRQGENLVAIGHPSGFAFTATTGIVSAVHSGYDLPEAYRMSLKAPRDNVWIQTSAAISGGNSGGPLLNMQGEVVGINTWVARGQNLGFATHSMHLADLMSHIRPSATSLAEANAARQAVAGIVAMDPRVKRITEEFERARKDFIATLSKATSMEQMADLTRKHNPIPEFVDRLFQLADENRSSPAALQALVTVCGIAQGAQSAESFDRAMSRIVDEHADDPKLGPLLFSLAESPSPKTIKLLAAIEAKSSRRELRAMACFGRAAALSSGRVRGPRKEREIMAACERVIKEYGDVPFRDSTLRELAEPLLFETQYLAVGKQVPEIEGQELGGTALKLSEHRGKVVVLDFFANWCPYCRRMYPLERAIVERYAKEPFALLGVNCDEIAAITPVFQQKLITWHCFWDGHDGPIAKRWNISSYPSIFVLDAKGTVRYRFSGDPGPELEASVQKLLDEAKGIKKTPEASAPEVNLAAEMELIQGTLASRPVAAAVQAALKVLDEHQDQVTPEQLKLVDSWITVGFKQSPNAVILLLERAQVRTLQDRPAETVKIFRALLKRKDLPPMLRPVVENQLAYVLALRGSNPQELDEALELINSALKEAGPMPTLLDTRAMVYWAQRKYDLARADLEEALDATESPVADFHLALVELDAGDKSSAREAFEQAKKAGLTPGKVERAERKSFDRLVQEVGQPAA